MKTLRTSLQIILSTSLLIGLFNLLPLGAAHASPPDVCPSGCTYSTIQAGVSALGSSGGTLTIGPGAYHEHDITVDNNINAISIFHPTYPSGPFQSLPGADEQNTLTQGVAGYLQDQMDACDNKLHLLLSGRADFVDQYNKAWQTPDTITKSKDLGFSGR